MPCKKSVGLLVLAATVVTAGLTVAGFRPPERTNTAVPRADQVMLILRGTPNLENPRGQLDDRSALEYARRMGFRGEVLDVAGDIGADSPQVRMSVERIRRDETVNAIYGFSGGGYNAQLIWQTLTAAERGRIRKVVVIGAPGVTEASFHGSSDVLIKPDPPAGHMAGPQALLESLGPEASGGKPTN